jgi:hypothetical protein
LWSYAPGCSSWSPTPRNWTLDVLAERVNVRNLIECRVRQEVEDFSG